MDYNKLKLSKNIISENNAGIMLSYLSSEISFCCIYGYTFEEILYYFDVNRNVAAMWFFSQVYKYSCFCIASNICETILIYRCDYHSDEDFYNSIQKRIDEIVVKNTL